MSKNVSSLPLDLTNTNFIIFMPSVAFLKMRLVNERYKTQISTLPINEKTNHKISPVTKLEF